MRPWLWAGRCYAGLTLLFLLSPLLIVLAVSVNPGEYVAFPPAGFSLRWYAGLLHDDAFAASLWLSLRVAVLATTLATLCGTAAALALRDMRFGGGFRALLFGPLLVPEVLFGLALLRVVTGTLGQDASLAWLVAAHATLVLPFVVQFVATGLGRMNRETLDAARTLGAAPGRVFRTITVPAITPDLAAGVLFAAVFSFDNVTISLFLSAPGLETLPVRLYEQATYSADPSLAAASALLILGGLFAALALRLLTHRVRLAGPV